ncbi:MAG: amino acid ABC transporter permease [Chloroflexi bacterium]|nr:amino acid ABC transporter permease [Chloroflexota bacterium]
MDVPLARGSQTDTEAARTGRLPSPGTALRWLYVKMFSVPWWGVLLFFVAIFVYWRILEYTKLLAVPTSMYTPAIESLGDLLVPANPIWANIFSQLDDGISLTLRVAFFSYLGALMVGLILGLIRSNPPKPATGLLGVPLSLVRLLVYQIATIFVEVMRGLPLLTTLVISVYALIPAVRDYLNDTFNLGIPSRGGSPEPAMIVLALAYGAFMSETFRAGIQSIERGQLEASRALGLNYIKTMRFVVLPQAIRRILPPLGNDFVSMIKDSALVSAIGLNDITQRAKTTSGSNFRYIETYLTAAVLYLTLTIVLSLGVKLLERRLKSATR